MAPLPIGATSSTAACPLVLDPNGDDVDWVVGGFGAGISEETLDLRSADIGANRDWFTVVIRVQRLTLPAATSPAGVMYTFALSTGEETLEFLAAAEVGSPARYQLRSLTTTGTNDAYLVAPTPLPVPVVGSMDPRTNEIRMSVRRREIERVTKLREGGLVRVRQLYSWRSVPLGPDSFVASADEATGDLTYRVGRPGCITAGPKN
ncbi:MAG: hypothetical protein ABR520_00575 [Mycobacteriales bacterium]|nr:hypothetical protein [Frankia sp.]